MGIVWSAFDAHLGRQVAVKILSPGLASSELAQDRLRSEVQLMHTVRHPGIAAVYDLCRHRELTFVVMELVEGVPLDALLRATRADDRRPSGPELAARIDRAQPDVADSVLGNEDWYRSVARITVAALRVLEAAHTNRVVHRDIKPGNIMLAAGGRPVLLDFGLARHFDTLGDDLTRGLSGTYHYFAPEQVDQNRTGANPSTDIYQMGAVLFELLTLERPIGGGSVAQVLANIARGAVRDPRDRDPAVPRELADICLCAMERVPARRYRTAAAFRVDLERFLDGAEVPAASRGSLLRRVRHTARRHRVALALIASVVITAVAVAAWLPAERVFDRVGAGSTEAIPHASSGREIYRVTATVDVRRGCDAYALLFVTRGGERFVYPMYGPRGARRVALTAGRQRVAWQTRPLPVGGVRRVEMFASVRAGGFDLQWDYLVAAAEDGDSGVHEATVRSVLKQLAERTRSVGASGLTADMVCGDAALGELGERVSLTAPAEVR